MLERCGWLEFVDDVSLSENTYFDQGFILLDKVSDYKLMTELHSQSTVWSLVVFTCVPISYTDSDDARLPL